MKKLSIFFAALFAATTMFAKDATMTAGTNGSAAVVNGVSAIKCGTSKAAGNMTITVGAGATSMSFYAAAWKGAAGTLTITAPDGVVIEPASVELTADDGISNNSPFTLAGDAASFKKDFTITGADAETTFTLTTAKRFVVWGATYEEGEGGETPDEPTTGCNWDELEFLGNGSGDDANTNAFKACLPEGVSVVNIQNSFGTEAGIYLTFPAAVTAVTLEDGQYAIQGAGMLVYVSAMTAKENAFTVTDGTNVTYDVVIYNVNGTEGGDEPGDDPETPVVYTCAQVQAITADVTDIVLNTVTVGFINGSNIFVYDETGMTQVYFKNSGLSAGQVVSGIAGKATLYNTYTPEFVPSNTAADWTIAAETVTPEFAAKTVAPVRSDVNSIFVFKGVQVEGEFTTASAINLTATIGEETFTLRNNYKYAYTFEAGKEYDITGVVVLYNGNPQVYFISAEEVAATPVAGPTAAPADPTYPANQVKAVYSATYDADCNFGEWGSGTVYAQEAYGKHYTTTGLGYFGLEFNGLNCSKMEALHMDIWSDEEISIHIVPIYGGTPEYGVTKTIAAGQWNALDILLTEGDWANVTNWSNVYQIKIDNASNASFWVNNVYFYTTQAPAADTEAPTAFTAALASASYFSAVINAQATDNSDEVIFVVMNGELQVASVGAVSGAATAITVPNLVAGNAYNFTVIAKDPSGNMTEGIAVAATTLAAPAPAAVPTYAANKVISLYSDVYEDIAWNYQDWWSGAALSAGALSENSNALLFTPTGAAGGCFGLAFAATDITAYTSVEMDVYPTTEGAKLVWKPIDDQFETQEATLVANQWNHVVFDITGNTKTALEQLGFYNNDQMGGAYFVQNVLIVNANEDVVPEPVVYNVAEAIAASLADDDEVSVRGIITKMEFKGKNFAKYGSVNIYVKDVTGAEGEFEFYNCYSLEADTFRVSVPEYDASSTAWAQFTEVTDGNGVTVHVGDTVIAFGKYKLYNTTYELNTGCYLTEIKPVQSTTPVEPQTIEIAWDSESATLEFTDATEDQGWWQLRGQDDTYYITLSNLNMLDAAAGTYTAAELDPEYSFVEILATEEDITFVSGSITLDVDADGNAMVSGSLVGADGNTYVLTILAEAQEVDYYPYDAESDFVVNFTSYTVDDSALEEYGSVYVKAQDAEGNYIILDITLPENADGLVAGTYPISANYDIQSVHAGFYSPDYSSFIPSYAATLIEQDGQYYYNDLWWIVSGTVIVDANLNVTVNAVNSLGSAVTVTLAGQSGESGIEAVELDAQTNAKRLINGNLFIIRDGKMFNGMGARVR